MEYTVRGLAQLAGVSARTLRYYHQIGLLRPQRITSGGYRIYGPEEVDRLQQILFYRETGMALEQIARILADPDFDRLEALRTQRQSLLAQRGRIDLLLQNLQRSIDFEERGIDMRDPEKFEGFKRELIEQNETAYGEEIRHKYGDDAVAAANARVMNLTPEQYARMERDGAEILRLLDDAYADGDPAGDAARAAVELHRRWLGYTWNSYTPEAHAGVARMYAEDQRFSVYYDRGTPGKAAFFRDAIVAYLGL